MSAKQNFRRVTILCIALVIAPLSALTEPESPRFAVVVNAENAVAEADPALIRLLYLKDLSEWPDGTPAKPIGRPHESPAHQAFLRQVLELKSWRLAEHWIALKQKNGSGKVRAVSRDAQVALLVQRYPGAFSILPMDIAENNSNIRVLFPLY